MGIYILLIALGITLITIIAILCYCFYYFYFVNKQLKKLDKTKRRRPSPAKFAVAAVVCALLLFSNFAIGFRFDLSELQHFDKMFFGAQYNCNFAREEEMQGGYLSHFAKTQNTGYSKTVKTVGDIKFTYFLSKEKYDTYHPAFFIYIEYIGKKDATLYQVYGDYLTSRNRRIFGVDGDGWSDSNQICIIGNTSENCSFEVRVFYYDLDGERALEKLNHGESFPDTAKREALAMASSTITIDITLPKAEY